MEAIQDMFFVFTNEPSYIYRSISIIIYLSSAIYWLKLYSPSHQLLNTIYH